MRSPGNACPHRTTFRRPADRCGVVRRGDTAARLLRACAAGAGGAPPLTVAYFSVSGGPYDSEQAPHGPHGRPGRGSGAHPDRVPGHGCDRAAPARACRGERADLGHPGGTRVSRAAGGCRLPALAAPKPGSGGWYWPVGTEDFQGWSGWLDKRGSYLHVAQDMPCAVGHPVYAIADGVVFISRADAGGYGVGGAPGGCIIIQHATASGIKFHALDGPRARPEGQGGAARRRWREVIAKRQRVHVTGFSIHPGFTYRDGNPYARSRPGLLGGPRRLRRPGQVPEDEPALALRTSRRPARGGGHRRRRCRSSLGAADGSAYWTEEGAAGSVTWWRTSSSGRRETLGAGESAPPFDAHRYAMALLAAAGLRVHGR